MPPVCARELRLRVPPDQLADLVRLLREEVAEFYRGMETYRSIFVYGDPATGEILSISTWSDSREQFRVSPSDVLTLARNAHGIDVTLVSETVLSVIFEDSVLIPSRLLSE